VLVTLVSEGRASGQQAYSDQATGEKNKKKLTFILQIRK